MSDEDVRDAIKEGQIFKGFILGNDDQIRIIVHLLTQEPAFNIGFYAHEGYGRIIVRIDKVEEQAEVPPSFANVFDVFTVAPVIMYDSNVLAVITVMVDTFMVASLGHAAVAATGLTAQPKFFLMAPLFALNAACGAIVARKRGEGDRPGSNAVSKLILLMASVYSLAIGIACVVFAKPIVMLCGGNSETSDLASVYFAISMGGLVFTALTMICSAMQRAMKNTRISMYAHISSMVVNVFLNYCLIYGHFGFPKLGVTGAAIATVVGTVLSFVIIALSLMKGTLFINIPFIIRSKHRIAREYVKSVVRLSAIFLSEDFIKRFSFLLIGIIAARTGTEPFAAHQVGMSLLNLAFAFGMGMQTASVVLAGNALGKKDISLARKYTSNCIKSGIVLGIVVGGLVLAFGTEFFGIYFTNPSFISIGTIICTYISIIIPIQVCQVILSGSLRASGDIRYTLLASTFTIGLLNLAVSFVLVEILGLGIQGFWIATLIGQTLLASMHFARFRSSKWENKKL